MSSVTPKLLYSNALGEDIPVWEIIPEKTKQSRDNSTAPIYYERVDYPGMIPIGQKSSIQIGNLKCGVFDVVNHRGNDDLPVLKAKNGYIAPMSWYEYEDKTKYVESDDESMETGEDYDESVNNPNVTEFYD